MQVDKTKRGGDLAISGVLSVKRLWAMPLVGPDPYCLSDQKLAEQPSFHGNWKSFLPTVHSWLGVSKLLPKYPLLCNF